MRLSIVALGLILATAACGGDEGGIGPGPEATRLAFTIQPSTTVAGQVLSPAVQVSIQDASGALVSGAANSVTLALESNPSAATLGGTTTATAQNGVATFPDLRIDQPGAGYTLNASATGLTSAQSDAFDVTPAPGVAVQIAPSAGQGQIATVAQAVAINPSVRVTDFYGDPVANVSVTFSVGSGGGSAIGLNQTTDADGVATSGQWTLGTLAQANTLLATSPGLVGSPVTFTATAVAGPAAVLSKFDGDEQIASVGTPVAQPPSVLVTDVYQNPVSGVPVRFEVTSGDGSITGAQQTTGIDGLATVDSWTLGNSIGPNSLTATSSGLDGSPVTFTATAATLPTTATVLVRSNYFRSVRNGSGGGNSLFGEAAVDTIAVGGSVTWQWLGQNHNVTAYQNPPTSPLTTSGNHSGPFIFGPITFTSPGTYRYRCTNHSSVVPSLGLIGMRGTIVVR